MYFDILYYSFVMTSSAIVAWRFCQSTVKERKESQAARERRHEKERLLKSQARAPPSSLCPVQAAQALQSFRRHSGAAKSLRRPIPCWTAHAHTPKLQNVWDWC